MRRIRLNALSKELIAKWEALEPRTLELDEYNKVYLQRYLDTLAYDLYLVQHLVDSAQLKREPSTVIDLGGGIGFNTVYLAFRFPNSKIVHLDVDVESSKAARLIHAALELSNVTYVVGELEAVSAEINSDTFICSRDVIEHIYDLEDFFTETSGAMANAHNTAAIHRSIFRSAEFKRIHHRAEYEGMGIGAKKARDHRTAYLDLRRAIIEAEHPDMDAREVKQIAASTRGLNAVDIQRFIETGVYPEPQGSCLYDNTCDPYTGNWAERCITPRDYRRFAKGLALQICYPAYNTLGRIGMKAIALRILNIFALIPIHRMQASFTLVY